MVKVQKLPYLALKCLISSLGPVEKIDFSLCSKKCRRAVKICTPKDSVKVTLNFTRHSHLTLNAVDCDEVSILDSDKLFKQLHHINRGNFNEIIIPWADYTCDVLNCKVNGMVFDICSQKTLSQINRWLKVRKESLQYCEIQEDFPRSHYVYILRNFDIELLNFNKNKSLKDYEWFVTIKKKLCLNMRDDQRVHLETILDCSCPQIEVHYGKWRRYDVYLFVSAWLRGILPDLSLFVITELDYFSLEDILRGIDATKLDDNVENRYIGIFNDNKVISGGWDIRRNDGEIATIKMSSNNGQAMFRLVSHSLFLN
ncbi:hypothetical protein CAEBREN_24722 [Caenorhabditis brenneri]|uniref:F-box domain-containing protein n=1 Tax=Caenorhabditis brenneri TaxID=135651 RepID=G0NCW7_CAEBE|nr:hypothetical protein CAEBREN_24722 [Caenorhabditis brenneri]